MEKGNGVRKRKEEKEGGKWRENGDREKKKKRETLRIEVRLKLHEWQNQ